MTTAALSLMLGSDGVTPPPVYPFPPPPGPPLPPLPGLVGGRPSLPDPYFYCYAVQPYVTGRPFTPPTGRDFYFERGDFCPTLPDGLRRIYPNKCRILSWDVIHYDDTELDMFFAYRAGVCGDTHLVLSMQQTLNQGKTIDDLRRAARAAKRHGLWITLVVFGAKWERGSNDVPAGDYFDTWAKCYPWVDALYQEGLVDKVCACWQEDFWWDPLSSYEEMWFPLIAWAAPNNIETIRHNGSDGCWWANAKDDPRDPNTYTLYGVYDSGTYRTLLQPIGASIAATAASRLGAWALAIEGRRMPDAMYVQIGPSADVEECQSTCKKILRGNPSRCVLGEQIANDLFADGVPADMDQYGKLRGRIVLASVSDDGRTFQGGLNCSSTDYNGAII